MYPFNWLTPKTREVIQKIVQTSDWRRPPSHTHTQTLMPRALRLKTTSCTLSNTKYGWGHGVAALPYGQYYLQGIIVATAVHASGRQGRQIQDTTGVRRYAFFFFFFHSSAACVFLLSLQVFKQKCEEKKLVLRMENKRLLRRLSHDALGWHNLWHNRHVMTAAYIERAI